MQCSTLTRNKGTLLPVARMPAASRKDICQVYGGYPFATARTKALELIQKFYPGNPLKSFPMGTNCHCWLVLAPSTGEPIELFVLAGKG